MKEIFAIAQHLISTTSGGVLATLVDVIGSSYRRPGARFLITPEKLRIGSVSGGCLEEDLTAHASKVAADGISQVVTYDTTSENDLVWGVGLGCNGVVKILLEKLPAQLRWAELLSENKHRRRPTDLFVVWDLPPGSSANSTALGTFADEPDPTSSRGAKIFHQTILPPTPLFVCGAGDDAIPLVRMANELGWEVTVCDPRPAFITSSRFPETRLVVAPAPSLIELAQPPSDALVVIMTHHYAFDRPILRALADRKVAYLGLLGPRKRAEKILSELLAEGVEFTPEWHERFHAPIGFDLGADAPEEIALAIMAEMQAVLTGRDGGSLRHRVSPIHA